jgi:hypothetical protein
LVRDLLSTALVQKGKQRAPTHLLSLINLIKNAGSASAKQLAVQSEMAMGEVAQRAGRLFFALAGKQASFRQTILLA